MAAAIGVISVLLALAAPAAAESALSYDPELHVYGFQRYDGDVGARPRQTRLFEPVGIEHREQGQLGPPKERAFRVRGAGSVALVDPQAPAASRPAQGASGLYLATVRRLVFLATGGTDWVTTTEFYLLSPEGRVQRGHGLPEVPGGDLRRFDYEHAYRADPGNSGSYTTSGNQVTITIGTESISATLAGPDELEIRGTKFKRSVR